MIKVTLLCKTGTEIPEGLEDVIDSESEWREAYLINTNLISGIYPHGDQGTLIEFVGDSTWHVREDLKAIKDNIEAT